MSKSFVLYLASSCLALATVTGCSGEPLSRSGAGTDPVTLTAAWGQGPSGIGGDVLGHLIDGTGDAAVRVVDGGPPKAPDTMEERHGVEKLLSGKADITVVRAGVLQLLGADSLAPLGAPFVVTNNDQAAAIAADPELSQQLMSGLDELGLVGLGLVPGGLRHPFGFGTEALLGAATTATRSSTCARTLVRKPCSRSSAPGRTTRSTASESMRPASGCAGWNCRSNRSVR